MSDLEFSDSVVVNVDAEALYALVSREPLPAEGALADDARATYVAERNLADPLGAGLDFKHEERGEPDRFHNEPPEGDRTTLHSVSLVLLPYQSIVCILATTTTDDRRRPARLPRRINVDPTPLRRLHPADPAP